MLGVAAGSGSKGIRVRDRYHQMLGHPIASQTPTRMPESTDAVLLQLVYDNDAGFRIGAEEIVFVIGRDDLRARRFNRVRASAEGD